MSRVKILDCTLRDGGYVNDWNFGEKPIGAIVNNLLDAGIDLIECGFISSKKIASTSKSLFDSFESADSRLKELTSKNKKLLFMINYGDYDQGTIPDKKESIVSGIRVAFHKQDMFEAMVLCENIKDKGYSVFVQPMNTQTYTRDELFELIDKTNKLMPEAIYIVDSLGMMRGKEINDLYSYYDDNLNKDISVGFHSHNNLQLSFSNAQEFIRCSKGRQIVIDSTLMGMGRGAGNLCTELIAQHLNENDYGEYDLLPILTMVDEVLYPLQSEYQWGYTIPYYLAATCGCHPNYATFLSNKQTIRVKDISALLKLIPDQSKSMYDQKMIEGIYIDFQNNMMDDSNAVDTIRKKVHDKIIVVVAPGRSYKEYLNKIHQHSNAKNGFIISVNFIDYELDADMAFFGNAKRYSEYSQSMKQFNNEVVVTSNVKSCNGTDIIVNYADYLNDDQRIIDNSGLMLINLLSKAGVEEIHLVGFDGFHADRKMNYYDRIENVVEREYLLAQNKSVSTRIKQLSAKIKIDFITPSIYENVGCDDL